MWWLHIRQLSRCRFLSLVNVKRLCDLRNANFSFSLLLSYFQLIFISFFFLLSSSSSNLKRERYSFLLLLNFELWFELKFSETSENSHLSKKLNENFLFFLALMLISGEEERQCSKSVIHLTRSFAIATRVLVEHLSLHSHICIEALTYAFISPKFKIEAH